MDRYNIRITHRLNKRDSFLKETLIAIIKEYPSAAKIKPEGGALAAVYVTPAYYAQCEEYVNANCNLRTTNIEIKPKYAKRINKIIQRQKYQDKLLKEA